MKNKVLEEFDSIILDSSQIKYLDDSIEDGPFLLNQFHIRAFINGLEKEYLFYDVLEVTQNTHPKNKSTTNQLAVVENNDWIYSYRQIRRRGYLIPIKDFSVFKHYIFNIEEYEFNILAEGYRIIDKFFEIFRKYENMKKIIL
ncbi:uncharacterized protein CHSO_3435 [Chryseobacterium sp. StRB126]|uniref:hypothetical protein n=1 Tax=Chryseobacterium sp. StRB126 TaxID=878220 RepID=UPI0004E99BC3|nr:hypothetical protein [Chryseobacterium sp. StRB126]BAP32472.1 uncharacterized protein CHSO_3435 [Chryseobacterium sp. StRB126]